MNEHIVRRLRQLRSGSINAQECANYIRKHAVSFGGLQTLGTSEEELHICERVGVIKNAKRYLSEFKSGRLMWGSKSTVQMLEECLEQHNLKAEDIGVTQEQLDSLPSQWVTKNDQEKEKNKKSREEYELKSSRQFVQELPVVIAKKLSTTNTLQEYQIRERGWNLQVDLNSHLAVLLKHGITLESLGVSAAELLLGFKAIAKQVAEQCVIFFRAGTFPFYEIYDYKLNRKFPPQSNTSPEWKAFCEALRIACLLPEEVGLTETFEEVLEIRKEMERRKKIQEISEKVQALKKKPPDDLMAAIKRIQNLCHSWKVLLLEVGTSTAELSSIVREHFFFNAHQLWNDPAWIENHPSYIQMLHEAVLLAQIKMSDVGVTSEEVLRRKLEWLEYEHQGHLVNPSERSYFLMCKYVSDPDIQSGDYEFVPPFDKRKITLAYAAFLANRKTLRANKRKELAKMIRDWKFTSYELGTTEKQLLNAVIGTSS